jgi:O-antigen/teichoic acid export membrane protein
MLGFGGNITAFTIVNYFSRKADDILIGRVWGAVEVGFTAVLTRCSCSRSLNCGDR